MLGVQQFSGIGTPNMLRLSEEIWSESWFHGNAVLQALLPTFVLLGKHTQATRPLNRCSTKRLSKTKVLSPEKNAASFEKLESGGALVSALWEPGCPITGWASEKKSKKVGRGWGTQTWAYKHVNEWYDEAWGTGINKCGILVWLSLGY